VALWAIPKGRAGKRALDAVIRLRNLTGRHRMPTLVAVVPLGCHDVMTVVRYPTGKRRPEVK